MVQTLSLKHVKLIKKAKETHGDIYPTAPQKRLYDGFTYEKDNCYFWFNTADGSTHIVEEVEKETNNAG